MYIFADQLNREERLYPVDKAMLDRQTALKGVSVSPVTGWVEIGITATVPVFISDLRIVLRFYIFLSHSLMHSLYIHSLRVM